MIEDLVPAAVNDANQKAKQLYMEAMKSLTDGLELPGLDTAIAKLTGTEVG
jgi:DNA-binding protein YbaB